MSSDLTYVGALEGHRDWVTCLDTNSHILVSGSRDKRCIVWDLEDQATAEARKSLVGHSHFIEDVILDKSGAHCLSASWDGTVKVWDIESTSVKATLSGHTKDVLCVALAQNRRIISGSRDNTLRLWNTNGKSITTQPKAHTNWVTSMTTAVKGDKTVVITGSWDKTVQVHSDDLATTELTLEAPGLVNHVAASVDGSLVAAGTKDGAIRVWYLNSAPVAEGEEGPRAGESLFEADKDIQAGCEVFCVAFSPISYLLVAGTSEGLKIFSLSNGDLVYETSRLDTELTGGHRIASVLSVAFTADGSRLFCGCSDGLIHVFRCSATAMEE
eukprot:gnl/Dysnectes_brevis/133_a158_8224.p2 GENE.gnl/Dysnectes_brevis/133_a158_8224~~gnl/Dysnectes_brevis/133_a158_8224.p2  ORF type:complete len:328 (+),score=96.51 gnl/Dysnectes_brevis/133_a158_8224:209-1192(+)